ncbi:acyltransferase family protein [Pseudobutyrivibrio xylanivorans]|uniref:Peptidoglycan/LPS O-acetylase OafA/YrhL, contains acyltransferase and SGNH-hydrolase domains n=1 Tax=Pseudobutyrivibrio xylanivorans DSM 14809 TaxID=1123012 RepID=A0A1M6IAT0_PSEXY|nr:acyltransferase [Pseudobutyrivibrio xylanivorans]SHJ31527.1 Peptidoglycan/LPS O-acetylase OafA/YrhL, contains acyltransferase and SGNH-hydrolase domains [Pseudobutyrivibrio xylanivorans DSM 14809]
MTMKTNRKTQFDIIRILAILMIFNYHFCMESGAAESIFCVYKNGGWGSVGTSIFFLLSGYLIHMGSKNTNIKTYIKKRFLSIYPALWLSFIIVYLLTSIKRNNYLWGGEVWRIILSFLGVDTYLQYYYIPTYSCVGEWFTAMIIFLYITYLLLRILIKKCPNISTIVITILYFAECIIGIQKNVPADASIFTALMLFWIGMLLQEYPTMLQTKMWKVVLAVIISVAVMFIKLPFIGNVLPWKNLLGIAIFYLLHVIFSAIKFGETSTRILKFFSSLSFAFYLIHHFVMIQIIERYGTNIIAFTYLMALIITLVTASAITNITNKLRYNS